MEKEYKLLSTYKHKLSKRQYQTLKGQIKLLNKLSKENKQKIYDKYGVNSIEELNVKQASEIINMLKGNK